VELKHESSCEDMKVLVEMRAHVIEAYLLERSLFRCLECNFICLYSCKLASIRLE